MLLLIRSSFFRVPLKSYGQHYSVVFIFTGRKRILNTRLQILSVSVFEKTSISCALQSDAHTTEPPDCAKQLNLFTF